MRNLPYVKQIRSKGKLYLYFDTGEKDNGKPVYKRLPPKSDPTFGGVYAAYLGHRTRRAVGVLTVPKLVSLYRASPKYAKLAPATQKLYGIYQGRFAEMLPTAPAGEIGRTDLVKLFDKMAATPGAANMMLSSVSALYRWGRRAGHVANRPADDIDPNDLGSHEPWPEALLNTALACDDTIVRLAVHMLYYTAARISDVVTMRWSHIDDGMIHVRPKKNRRHKQELFIPLHPGLVAELNRRESDLRTVLHDPDGMPLTEAKLRRILQAWAKGQGHEVVPHGLRKNAVNALLEVGCSVAQTAAISGQSLQMVEHYARKRNQPKLARSAMKLWGGTESESGN